MSYFSAPLSRRSFLGAAGATIGGLTLAACSSSGGGTGEQPAPNMSAADADLVDKARNEGGLNIYSAMTPGLMDPLVAAFTKAYGIRPQVTRLTSDKLQPRFGAEMSGGQVTSDVLQNGSKDFMATCVSKKWLTSLPKLVSAKTWPEGDWNGYFATVVTGPICVSRNTNTVSDADAPKSWEDILDPKYKGKILFVTPGPADSFSSWMVIMAKTYGDDFLRKLKAQKLTYIESTASGSTQLAAGGADLLLPTTPWAAQTLVKQGAPVKNEYLKPTCGLPYYAGAVQGAKHPASAELWMDFVMSRPGQTAMAGSGFAASLMPGVEGAIPLGEGFQPPNEDEARAQFQRLAALVGVK